MKSPSFCPRFVKAKLALIVANRPSIRTTLSTLQSAIFLAGISPPRGSSICRRVGPTAPRISTTLPTASSSSSINCIAGLMTPALNLTKGSRRCVSIDIFESVAAGSVKLSWSRSSETSTGIWPLRTIVWAVSPSPSSTPSSSAFSSRSLTQTRNPLSKFNRELDIFS